MLFYRVLLFMCLQQVAAQPSSVVPEVIPGPGLPSLAELGLTSAELYDGVYSKTQYST